MGIIRFFTGGQYSLVNKISLFLLFVSMATAITTTVMAGKKDEHKYKYTWTATVAWVLVFPLFSFSLPYWPETS